MKAQRIAILATGQCRQLWLSAPSLYANVIEPNNADVFLYLNKNSMEPLVGDAEEEIVKTIFPKNVKSLIFTDDNYNKELEELIDSNYSKIDGHYKKLGRHNFDVQLNHHNSCQYLKLKKCCEAAVAYATENGFKYDVIVRCRPDIGWLNHFDLLRPINPDLLYVNYSEHHVVDKYFPWVEDTCFFGGQDSMLKFCSDFSDKMVDELDICSEEHDLTCATEKLLAKVLINSRIKYTGINDYFGYTGEGWIRKKLDKYFTSWEKSPNYYLIEKYANGAKGGLAVYFDKIDEIGAITEPTIII